MLKDIYGGKCMEIQNRIDEALNLRGMKRIELSEKTNINKSSISSYCKQRWQPKQDALHKMAKVLEVSELWLAGYDVPMERPVAQKKMDQLAESILKIKSNDRYINIINEMVKLKEDQLILVENLITQLVKN